ncbi:poly(ethylene terephthalate) hydrolase family protein [Actinophytocola algeriensis]|uniref:poly(ethylene terephthalate) hydrolase family protein n=1 Tax=Actinophytocola algeriensis TaxID=1768010 RepID=UPI0040633C3B
MGPWLASFGFVVIGVETNGLTDFDTARGTQLPAALDYLTQVPVRAARRRDTADAEGARRFQARDSARTLSMDHRCAGSPPTIGSMRVAWSFSAVA